MDDARVLYAIAESCPFDSLLVREMRKAVEALLQLNLRRFRVPQQSLAKYSALDIVKQALELLFEFSPSVKNYREAMRTIRVYAENEVMLATLESSFRLIANAVYNAYTGQRHAESLEPRTLFLQGVRFDPSELQKSFRFVGVRPPEISPASVQKTVFLDEGQEGYSRVLEGKLTDEEADDRRFEHWAGIILENFDENGKNLIRAGMSHIGCSPGLRQRFNLSRNGQLQRLLKKRRVDLEIIERVADVNQVFGK